MRIYFPARANPELSHRNIFAPTVGCRRRWHPPVRFDTRLKPARVTKIIQRACKILAEHLFNYTSKVSKEALTRLWAVHHHPRKNRQIRHDIVAAALCELLLKGVRPVLRAGLPTVDKHIV